MATHIFFLLGSIMILVDAATRKQQSCQRRIAIIKRALKSIPVVEKDCNIEFELPCEPPAVESAVWSTYVRWGRTVCPDTNGTSVLYKEVPFKATNAPDTNNPHSLTDHDVPCVVCQIPRNLVMIPALHTCPNGWNKEYKGYLVAEHHAHANNKAFECMDEEPETIDGGHENKNGALFLPVQAVCGSLPCPKYVNGRELTCIVCSK
ncbi:unnamed protein product [Owenia fusiformis]|uniref:Secreted protein n=1 Tax=Owenia fusiformis TaxID=6347 RepID=A0A8S4PP26_OWEFU|nr:unnamed protein product [Owenia fusiformis]